MSLIFSPLLEKGDRVAEGIAETIERYVLDGTDDDLKRLLKISEVSAKFARTALHRAGVRPAWSAIECGCGPLGALPTLADAVGPSGRVVGVDVNAAAIERARSIMGSSELPTCR